MESRKLTTHKKAKIFYQYSCGLNQEQISKNLRTSKETIIKLTKMWNIHRDLSASHKGKHSSPSTQFNKGHHTWNKGIKLPFEVWNKGKKTGIKPKTSFKKGHPYGKRFVKGQPSLNKGKPAPWVRGANNVNWKGGISDKNKLIRESDQYKQWRRDVFVRDQFTCQKCGHRFIKIVAHHIKSFSDYPNLRFDVNNGQTLCRACHCKVHKNDLVEARGL